MRITTAWLMLLASWMTILSLALASDCQSYNEDGTCSARGLYNDDHDIGGKDEDNGLLNADEDEFDYEEGDFDEGDEFDDEFDDEEEDEDYYDDEEGDEEFVDQQQDFPSYSLEDITEETFYMFPDPEQPENMLYHTPFGVDQTISSSDETTIQVMADTKTYMMETVLMDDEKYLHVRDKCRLRDTLCAYWAGIGECEVNPAYMALKCAPACQSCDQIDYSTRCPWSVEETPNALIPPSLSDDEDASNKSTLNHVFERLVSDPWFQEQYHPVILSRDPWVVTLETFLTDDECDALIRMGGESGYERSEDVGEEQFDGSLGSVRSSSRTSHNTWCSNSCYDSEVNQRILRRIENVTTVPMGNYEHLQLLKYDVGQYYKVHHDYIEQDLERPQGPRIFTVFLYVSERRRRGWCDALSSVRQGWRRWPQGPTQTWTGLNLAECRT